MKRILVADNNRDFLSITKSLLEVAGFRVKTAKDGAEVLGQIKKIKYDLLVLGVVMPRIDGIRLLQVMRKSKLYADVPILFVFDYPIKEELVTRQVEMTEKGQGHIQRPFMNKAFLEMVAVLLEKNRVVEARHF